MDGFVMVKGEMEEEDETAASAPPQPMAGLHDIGPPPFLMKTFEIVEDSETDAVVSWSSAKNSFIVWDSEKFSTTLLPKYFKHGNFSSFIRQLNTYISSKSDQIARLLLVTCGPQPVQARSSTCGLSSPAYQAARPARAVDHGLSSPAHRPARFARAGDCCTRLAR